MHISTQRKQVKRARTYFQDQEQGTLDISATRLFFENYNSKAKVIVNRGGARSSKSYSLAQLFIQKLLTEKSKKILILRKSLPSLRISIYRTMKDVAESFQVSNVIKEEKVAMNWVYEPTKSFIHFGSLDNPEKIKSSEWNYIWMEEATEFLEAEYHILRMRLSAKTTDGRKNQMVLSFNPIDEYHWIKEKLVDDEKEKAAFLKGKGGVQEIVSTYRDNPFLDKDYIEILQGLIDQDFNYYRIYALGEWGKLENIIFSNWEIVDVLPDGVEKFDVIYGVDFGYNAPMVLTRHYVKDYQVWDEQLLYKTGMTNKDLIAELKKLIPYQHKRCPIYCDSAETDRIQEIAGEGFNALPSMKSVKDGIDFLKRFKTHILSSSDDLIKEYRSYSWRTDKLGRPMDEPVDFMDHAISAKRYALYTHFKNKKEYRLRWI